MSQSILFVDQFGEVGGGQAVLQALVRVAKEDGRRVGVLAPMGSSLESALRATWGEGVALYHLKTLALQSRRKDWKDACALLAYCVYTFRFWWLVAKYDIVYINGARLALPFYFLSLISWKQRWFYHVHLCHTGLEKRIFSRIASSRRTSGLVMASRVIYDDFMRAQPEGRLGKRIQEVENCLSSPFSELAFSDRFSKRPGPLTVALIGRVVAYKGHDVLPGLAETFPHVRFVIIGACSAESGTLLSALMARRLSNLEYLGETRDVAGLLEREAVQISIVPSRWEEPFGLVSIESMAVSCLTLVSDRGMLPYIAEATGAWCFYNDKELSSMMADLCEMRADELLSCAREQYAKTRERFGFAGFREGILSVLAEPSHGELEGGGLLPSTSEAPCVAKI